MRLIALFIAAALAGGAAAQPTPGGPPGPPRIDFARELGISAAKAAQVEAILANEREQHRAAHEKARAELAKVLTPEELARMASLLPRPRPPGPGPMGGPPPERR